MKQAESYKIIDAHTHIFPEKIAVKASKNIGHFYDIPMRYDGMAHTLVESGRRIGVSKYLVCSTATKPEQVESINDFVESKCKQYPEFFGFATLHPAYPDIERELDRIAQKGLHGIKLHPDFQAFDIDAPEAITMYKAIAKRGLPILFHTGDDRYDYSAPKRLYHAMAEVPDLVSIAAHFGGYRRWEEADRYLQVPNVYFDTSSSLFKLSPEDARAMIAHMGEDRFFFGTDYPMWDHEEELARFMNLKLSREQNEKIFHQNFEKLFGIQV